MKEWKNENRVPSKSGMTMVEVLVAFAVVLLMSTMFARVILSSAHIQNLSRQVVSGEEAFEQEYYSGVGERTTVQDSLVLSGEGEQLSLTGRLERFTGSGGQERYYFYTEN